MPTLDDFDSTAINVAPGSAKKNRRLGRELFDPEAAASVRDVDTKDPDVLFSEGSEFKPTRRDEIVGIDPILDEVDSIVHWLKYSKAYNTFESRLEPGVIFEGQPGTGKTLVSRYIATASGALFVNVRDWPHKGSLFRDTDIAALFARARRYYSETNRPVILFWDEFEQGAWERGNASPEVQASVSQLTAELDGIHGKNEGLLLIGCTNYYYSIDTALRRSGRMGVHIEFTAPDRQGKQLLLNYYLGKYTLEGPIDVQTLSYFFDSGACAADIEESCMEAWRFAVRRIMRQLPENELEEGIVSQEPSLNQEDLVDVFLKRLVGPPTAFVNLPLEERERIAVHEVGHALMAIIYDIPLRLITVQPGKKAVGRVMTAEMQDHIGTIDEMVSQMRIGLGSIMAERVCKLPAMLGSGGDVRTVNEIAARLVDRLGTGPSVGLMNVSAISGSRCSSYGDMIGSTALERSDSDVKDLIDKAAQDAHTTMSKVGRTNLAAIARAVNERVTLTGAEFQDVVEEVIGHRSFSNFRA